MAREEIEEQYKVNETIYLTGYTSTSQSLEVATIFAFSGSQKEDKVPLIFEIDFCSTFGMFKMNKGCSAFSHEEEVLVQDGLCYRVISVEYQLKKDTKQEYFVVKLQYKANY